VTTGAAVDAGSATGGKGAPGNGRGTAWRAAQPVTSMVPTTMPGRAHRCMAGIVSA
jgi:hypothetical protein